MLTLCNKDPIIMFAICMYHNKDEGRKNIKASVKALEQNNFFKVRFSPISGQYPTWKQWPGTG